MRLTLQNGGDGTCAVAYQTGFLTIGGDGDRGTHGKVDRCLIHHPHHHQSLSVPGTTLKAITWVPFPTWPHLDGTTPAQVFSPVTGSRWKYPHVVQFSFFCISNRPCLLLEVGTEVTLSCTCRQSMDGQQEETFPGNLFSSNHLNQSSLSLFIIFIWFKS